MEDIKSKKQPAKKVLDVSRPTKRTAAAEVPSAPELVIPKRSVIPVTESEIPTGEPIAAKREARKVTFATADNPQTPSETEPTPTASSDTAETPTQPSTSPEKPATAPPKESAQLAPPPDESELLEQDSKDKPSKTDADVQKALEEAKRQQELQGYIENRDFFVPINAIARKRSVEVSIALTFVELLLGLLLLNLMLDAGIIQLLEKIPHTNFFDLN
jgi:hypothetical protein